MFFLFAIFVLLPGIIILRISNGIRSFGLPKGRIVKESKAAFCFSNVDINERNVEGMIASSRMKVLSCRAGRF